MLNNEIKILTYNIHKGFGPGNVRFHLPEIKNALNQLDADIIFLQEIMGEHIKKQKRILNWPKNGQAEYLAGDKLHYIYGKNAHYQQGHHGNAIISKWTLEKVNNIILSNLPRASRGLLHAVLSLPNSQNQLHLICIHLGLSKRARNSHIYSLQEYIQKYVPPNEMLILAGDFNDWRREDTETIENEIGLIEAFKWLNGKFAKTYPSFHPAFCTDRIYFRGLKLIEAQCLSSEEWRSLSDHLPLLAIFSFGF